MASSVKWTRRVRAPTVFPTWAPPEMVLTDGYRTLAPERGTMGSWSPAPRGCHRAASSRTPRTLRPWNSRVTGGAVSVTGVHGLTFPALNLAPAGLS